MVGRLVIGLVLILVLVSISVAFGSVSQWKIDLKLYANSIGGSPYDVTQFGVTPGPCMFEPWLCAEEKCPRPNPPMVFFYWYRTDINYPCNFYEKYFVIYPIPSYFTFQNLRVERNPGSRLYLTWAMTNSAALMPPSNYVLILYDEGTSPNPGGTPINMRKISNYSFELSANQTRYFHITVYASACPTSSFSAAPNPCQCSSMINVDASSSSGTTPPLVYEWDFDEDGNYDDATGIQATALGFSSTGSHPIGLKITDDNGLSSTTSQPIMVVDNSPPVIECQDVTVPPGLNCVAPCPNIIERVIDNCDPSVNISQNPLIGTSLAPGTTLVTATATDASGNTASCTANVVVVVPSELDLPFAGWDLIAQPHSGNHALRDSNEVIMVKGTGLDPIPFCEAAALGLVQSPLYFWGEGGYLLAGCDPWDEPNLRQGKGYWISTSQPNITLIFP